MIAPKILCLVPTLPSDLHTDCEKAILSQTVLVDKIVFVDGRVRGGNLPSRVSYVLNRSVKNIDIEQYDYILRVDCDTILSRDFLEKALVGMPDLVGNGGYAMLIRVKPFLDLMGGKFNRESDDSYIFYKFKVEGLKVRLSDNTNLKTRVHQHSTHDQMFKGTIYYKIGYEPIHVLGFLFRNRAWGDSMGLLVLGYFISLIKHESKFDFAKRVWNYQIRRLIHATGSHQSL